MAAKKLDDALILGQGLGAEVLALVGQEVLEDFSDGGVGDAGQV